MELMRHSARRPFGHRGILAAAILALLLSACAQFGQLDRQVSLPEPPKQSEAGTAAQREHQRILSAYGGAYQDTRLEALIGKTVERLRV